VRCVDVTMAVVMVCVRRSGGLALTIVLSVVDR
jgi:hypothetical protein